MIVFWLLKKRSFTWFLGSFQCGPTTFVVCSPVISKNPIRKELDAEVFELFFKLIYYNNLVVLNVTDIVPLIELSYLFLAPMVLEQCNAYINNNFDKLDEITLHLLELARTYDNEELKNVVIMYMKDNIADYNVSENLNYCEMFDLPEVKNVVIMYMKDNIADNNVSENLNYCEILDLPEVKESVIKFMKATITFENCSKFLDCCEKFNLTEVKEHIIEQIKTWKLYSIPQKLLIELTKCAFKHDICELKMIGSLDIFKEVDCNVKFAKSLSNIKKEYANFIGVETGSLKFTFNGKEVKDCSTPNNLQMNSGDIIQVERKPYEKKLIESNNVRRPEIEIKMIRKCDGNEANLLTKRYTQIYEIRDEYMKKVRMFEQPTLVYEGRILTGGYKTLKDDDTLTVYTDEVPIIIKVSLRSEISNGIEFSTKFGDAFVDILKEYTDRVGIEFESVRFMQNGRRINPLHSPKHYGILEKTTFEVLPEYETITLKIMETYPSKEFQIQVNYFDTFRNIKEEYARLGADPIAIEFNYKGNGVLDNQTPKELDMADNDTIEFYKQKVTTLQFKSDSDSIDRSCRVKFHTSLDMALKKYAEISEIDFDSVNFIYKEHRIRPGNTPARLKMDILAFIEVQNKQIISLDLKFIGSDDAKVTLNLKYKDRMSKVKQEYAALFGEDINRLRLMFNGKEVLDEETPEYLKKQYNLNENSIIEVRKEDKPIEYINIKMIYNNEFNNEFDFRIPSDYSLGGLKAVYADHIGKHVSKVRFLFDDRRINDEDTAKDLGMKEDDVIEVYGEVVGGPKYLDFTNDFY